MAAAQQQPSYPQAVVQPGYQQGFIQPGYPQAITQPGLPHVVVRPGYPQPGHPISEPAAQAGGEEVVISGFVDCCVCCGRGTHVEATLNAAHLSFKREERQCGECCTGCNAMTEESVELHSLEAATWHKGSCCSWSALCRASLCCLLCPLAPLGCLVYLLVWGEADGTAIELTTAGDLRPSERGPSAGQLQLPSQRYDDFWAVLRQALGASKAAPGLPPLPPSHHLLSGTSTLSIAPSRVLELTQAPCCCLCGSTRTLAHARSVQWARLPMPQCCSSGACCGTLQLGLGAPAHISVPMRLLGSSALLPHLQSAMLLRPAAGAMGARGAPATFTTSYPCSCGEEASMAMDADFTVVRTPGQVLVVRTSDVPFVSQERSGGQLAQALVTLLALAALGVLYTVVGGLAFRASIYVPSVCGRSSCTQGYYTYSANGPSMVAWFLLSPLLLAAVWWALSAAGLVSLYSVVSCCCCCRFSKVAVGTPGAAESEPGSACSRCGKSAQRKELYKWTDRGQEASEFVRRARKLISQARALDKEHAAAHCLAATAQSGAQK
jgi:hypothetical protein